MAGEQHRLSDNACPLWESSFFNLYVIGYFILFSHFFLTGAAQSAIINSYSVITVIPGDSTALFYCIPLNNIVNKVM